MCWLLGGLEVAGFVEYIVGGQEHFVLLEDDASVGQQCRGVGDALAGGMAGPGSVAHQDGQWRFLRQTCDLFAIAFEEAGPLEEIERKIAADAEFGENGQVGAGLFGLVGQFQDAGGIARKIAYGGIELGESDLHRA